MPRKLVVGDGEKRPEFLHGGTIGGCVLFSKERIQMDIPN